MAISIWAYPEICVNGKWQCATEMRPNPEYYSSVSYPDEEPCPYPKMVPMSVDIGDSRIYAALLINERSAWSDEVIAPIVRERGFPEDACKEIAADYISMGEDATHANWITLKEIIEFNWDKHYIHRSALVSNEDSAKFGSNQHGLPHGVEGYSEVSNDGCRVTWTDTYRQAFGEKHLSNIIRELGSYGINEDVRLILWCDR
jgi:hypothetical protein